LYYLLYNMHIAVAGPSQEEDEEEEEGEKMADGTCGAEADVQKSV
jgi:hypothetical protein